MKTNIFRAYEQKLAVESNFSVLGEATLKPGEEREFWTYSSKAVTIDFKTDLDKSMKKKCKKDGIGIKKVTSINYYLKDPTEATMSVLPDDGMVKVKVKNFEKFPITVKLYKKPFNKI